MFWCLPFDRHLEMHLQNGLVLYICSNAYNLSVVSGFGVVSGVSGTVLISGVTVSILGCSVRSPVMLHWAVLHLVWNVGPSRLVAVSI